ncbi:MAG: polyribonucleotide nucleotidyltransferase [Proteobacteria bacterium]|nr:polyribonucleotide nucleotidyltransferase [Pseudomonadota bacterium]
MIIRESVKVGDAVLTLETGRVAKQAQGSCIVSCGETVVLVTACGTQEPRPGVDFLPLSVDYVEKTYAAGKIPGGFFKREGRLRDDEILTSRLIDRPCRPLFPDGYRNEIQVIATVLSADKHNPSDVLAMVGASAALHLSPVPWQGPIAGVRVGRVDGSFVANPSFDDIAQSDMDIVMAASRDAIVMVEGECDQASEEDFLQALFFGHQAVQQLLDLIERMREVAGKQKWGFAPEQLPDGLEQAVRDTAASGAKQACNVPEKHIRYDRFKEIKKQTVEALTERFPDEDKAIKHCYEQLRSTTMRSQILDERQRVDGRDLATVRPITIEVGWLPRTHGSSLFTRGETQAIVTTTLGTGQDEQKIDALTGERWKRFLLHYNFPPFSVGETRPLRGPGRREVGHGHLAERALSRMLPSKEDFPYTIRLVSEITESNGSSSMATVCGGALSMMDAGVPIRAPVAGIAMGLVKDGDNHAVLTDILGDEDHLGDMDFKVCGTAKGITAIQMDIKIEGLTRGILEAALRQARDARLHVLAKMTEVLAEPRSKLSPHAPRITTIQIKPDQIRAVIGPGGKMIKAIVDQTGATIDIEDDGTVAVASPDEASVEKAIEIIRNLTMEPEVGQIHKGTVNRVEAYGAFVEISPGKDGLLHISELDWKHVPRIEDYVKLGDEIEVKITEIDREGRVRVSRKELLAKPEGWEERPPPASRAASGGGGGGRGRGGPRRGGGDRPRRSR